MTTRESSERQHDPSKTWRADEFLHGAEVRRQSVAAHPWAAPVIAIEDL
jgi:hypothetical protein